MYPFYYIDIEQRLKVATVALLAVITILIYLTSEGADLVML